jgi:hypothetical protein
MATIPSDPPWIARVAEMAQRADDIADEMNKPEVASNGAMMVKLARETRHARKGGQVVPRISLDRRSTD